MFSFTFAATCACGRGKDEEKIEDGEKVLRKPGNVIENGLRNFMEIIETIMIISLLHTGEKERILANK